MTRPSPKQVAAEVAAYPAEARFRLRGWHVTPSKELGFEIDTLDYEAADGPDVFTRDDALLLLTGSIRGTTAEDVQHALQVVHRARATMPSDARDLFDRGFAAGIEQAQARLARTKAYADRQRRAQARRRGARCLTPTQVERRQRDDARAARRLARVAENARERDDVEGRRTLRALAVALIRDGIRTQEAFDQVRARFATLTEAERIDAEHYMRTTGRLPAVLRPGLLELPVPAAPGAAPSGTTSPGGILLP